MTKFFATLLGVSLLASCMQTATLSPSEVLELSVHANQALSSAHFVLDAEITTRDAAQQVTSGYTVEMFGDMQSGGSQLSFTVNAASSDDAPSAWNATADVIVIDDQDVYLNVSDLTSDSEQFGDTAATMSFFANTWWKLPASSTGSTSPMSPDPHVLAMQAEIVDVVHDNGIVRLGEGQAYHYDVTVNPNSLRTFLEESGVYASMSESEVETMLNEATTSGELWIDAETYFLRKAIWHIQPVAAGTQIDLTLDISEHNSPKTISAPPGAADLPIDLSQFLPATSL